MFATEVDAVFDGVRYSGEGAVVIVDDGRIAGVEPRGTALSCEVTRFEGGTAAPSAVSTSAAGRSPNAPSAAPTS